MNVESIYCVLIIKYLGTLRWDGQALVTCQDVFWSSNPISDNSQASFPCFGWGDGANAELVFFNLKNVAGNMQVHNVYLLIGVFAYWGGVYRQVFHVRKRIGWNEPAD